MFLKKLKAKHLLILILLIAASLRLYRLDFPSTYVFDEVYHAFTAKEYSQGHKEAWEWWTTPPPGVAYEWTHPPLAKEIMAASMFVLKTDSPWAYRLPGVILGIFSIFLVYLLGKKLFNNTTPSLIAAFIFSLDGLNFVQSRTGMNDIYFITFILLSLLLFLQKKYFFSALILGLAMASKWTAVYIYLLFLPLLLFRLQPFQILCFIFIPPLVYLCTYLPFFLQGHDFNQFIELHKQMWWYHTNLKATHTYSSPWWSWPLNLYPVWYFVDYQNEKIGNIFASGNPVVFWVGFTTIFLTAWESFKKRSLNLLIIVLGFLVFWLPWAFSPRIMFLYHFAPSVPFLSLALGYQLNEGLKENRSKKLVILLIMLIILNFILLYPFLTAIHLPKNFNEYFFSINLSKNPFN
ncbi:hypothetical protein A3A45_03795 [Candidatus Daviesbacteria bacterium RIFCSPLOWO2_01_FULL_36_8]|nr:MAG: hypothetical protein A3A45_03795 [Candidatus Daviesbacteria bacterium RIFCSPLOWO2_01_FULL_36_8]